MAKERTVHYRVGAFRAKCGTGVRHLSMLTRDQSKVTCRNCIRGKGVQPMMNPLLYDDPRSATKAELRLHIAGLEAKIASLTSDFRRTEDQLDKAIQHAEHIQSLAAEGKDPLTGDEPEFWLVWRRSGGHAPTFAHSTRESASSEARRLSEQNPGVKFYILPAFEYCIAEVSPVAWHRASEEVKQEAEEELPF